MPLALEAVAGLLLPSGSAQGGSIRWKHLSSVNGDLPVPNSGKEQTASLVCDIRDKIYNWQAPRLDIWLNEGPP
jgi:hypothetical protein